MSMTVFFFRCIFLCFAVWCASPGADLQSQSKAVREAVPLGRSLATEGSNQTPSLLLVLFQNLLDCSLGTEG
jgi:hypothetical protein